MTSHLTLGLMSGTSADGVSAALVSFSGRSFQLQGFLTHAYPESIGEKIRQGPRLTVNEVSALNVEIGDVFAQAANKILKKFNVAPGNVTCIGSHGQTVYHGPRDQTPNTLQIGDPAIIAERTGISVVSNFRQRDMALGGQGAPLIPFFDQYFYGDGPVRAFQNIGGIANVTVVGKGIESPLAFDTGPGNGLMDLAMRLITNNNESHDHNGTRAKHGKIKMDAISRMIEHPYFKLPPPKSTGPELFNEAFLLEHLGDELKNAPDDVLATLNYFTCLTIQESYRQCVFPKYPIEDVVISGGGVYNKTLMKKLECLFAPIPVVSIEKMGFPSQAKEPIAFAFFGLRTLQGKINHLPSATGARAARVLGSITRA